MSKRLPDMIAAETARWRYRYYTLRYPGCRDFFDKGLGIEARFLLCGEYWRPHLELCREAQRRFLRPAASAAVLGAGRLYDLDRRYMCESFRRLALFDADPYAIACCRAALGASGRFSFHLAELTASLRPWTRRLARFLQSRGPRRGREAALARLLRGLEPGTPRLPECYDALISLNLLGQIPLYWRDRCRGLVYRRWGLGVTARGSYADEELEQSLLTSMARLQAGHLALLAGSGARQVLILSDTDYCFYREDAAEWEMEHAILIPAPIALEGYALKASDSWLWHVAPRWIEKREQGAIHYVAALLFEPEHDMARPAPPAPRPAVPEYEG